MNLRIEVGEDIGQHKITIAIDNAAEYDTIRSKIAALSCETPTVGISQTYFHFYPQHSDEEKFNCLKAYHTVTQFLNDWMLKLL